MNYEEGHPLHGRDAKWISKQADDRADWAIDNAARSLPRETVALAHEYRRLKAEQFECAEDLACVLLSSEPMVLDKAVTAAAESIRNARASAPPSDWLTRATKAAGAPEGSDWAGLLEHVKRLKENEGGDWYTLLSECSKNLGMHLGDNMSDAPELARKLRKRAESAETERDKWQALAHEDYRDRCNKYRERAEAAEAERDMYKQTAAQLGIGPLRPVTPTPTQSDLSRIAADVSRIATALEKRSEPLADAEPYIHTQNGGKFSA